MSADSKYEDQNDATGGDVPSGDYTDNDYAKSSVGDAKGVVPVQKDDAPVEDPIDPATADSDETLERDDREAIDSSNIIKDRTRGATKKAGTYAEPGDEEGLPGPDDGRSAVAT